MQDLTPLLPKDGPTYAEARAKEMGLELVDGVWEPKDRKEKEQQIKGTYDKAVQQRKSTVVVLVSVISIVLLLPVLFVYLISGSMDPSCLTAVIVFVAFISVLGGLLFASNQLESAHSPNLAAIFPTVAVRKGRIYLNGELVDYRNVSMCEVDRLRDEFHIVDMQWRRRIIPLAAYELPDSMVAAMKTALRVNKIKVHDAIPDDFETDTVREISHGNAVQRQTEETISHRKRMAQAAQAVEDERQREEERKRAEAELKRAAERANVEKKAIQEQPPIEAEVVEDAPMFDLACPECGTPINEDLIECPKCGRAY